MTTSIVSKKKTVSTAATTSAPEAPSADAQPTASPVPGLPIAYIAEVTALLDKIEKALPESGALTKVDKRRQSKARKGGERYIPQVVSLAQEFGVSLKLAPIHHIQQHVAEATALAPLEVRLGRLYKRVRDRLFLAQSVSWSSSTKLYSVLRRLSKDDGDLEAGLAPIEQFFNRRHPLVAKNHPKTAKGKAALKEAKEKAAARETIPQPSAAEAPPAAPTEPHAAPPLPAAVNGVSGLNGAAGGNAQQATSST